MKVSKVPINPRGLGEAKTNDPRTWGTFEDCIGIECALEGWEAEDPDAYRGGGVGFVLTATDPFTGTDLDHCRNPETDEIAPWARQIVRVINSYTEVSPSGTGLRIFARGDSRAKGGSAETSNCTARGGFSQ